MNDELSDRRAAHEAREGLPTRASSRRSAVWEALQRYLRAEEYEEQGPADRGLRPVPKPRSKERHTTTDD